MGPTKYLFTREEGKWVVRRGNESTVTDYPTLSGAILHVLNRGGEMNLVFSHCAGTMNFQVCPEIIRPGFIKVELFAETFRDTTALVAMWMAASLQTRLYN